MKITTRRGRNFSLTRNFDFFSSTSSSFYSSKKRHVAPLLLICLLFAGMFEIQTMTQCWAMLSACGGWAKIQDVTFFINIWQFFERHQIENLAISEIFEKKSLEVLIVIILLIFSCWQRLLVYVFIFSAQTKRQTNVKGNGKNEKVSFIYLVFVFWDVT